MIQPNDQYRLQVFDKVYIPDTSAALYDPDVFQILAAPGNAVVITAGVISQLDRHKMRNDFNGYVARKAARTLKEFRLCAKGGMVLLKHGVQVRSGGWVFTDSLDSPGEREEAERFRLNDPVDNEILAIARKWQRKQSAPVIIVTQDTEVLLQADAYSIEAEDFERDKIASIADLYSGTEVITIQPGNESVIQKFYSPRGGNWQCVVKADIFDAAGKEYRLYPNQCCYIKDHAGKVLALAIYKQDNECGGRFCYVERRSRERKKDGIFPLNDEQALAYALLKDPDVEILTLVGPAGTGKTLFTLKAGYEQVRPGDDKNQAYQQQLIFIPLHEVGGEELGFFPGTEEEKMEPWAYRIWDNLDYMQQFLPRTELPRGRDLKRYMVSQKFLRVSPLSHIRGRSLHNIFTCVEDAQNITPGVVKTAVARIAAGSKIVFTGDPGQIDNPVVTDLSNGLVYLVEHGKGDPAFGHIVLREQVRSRAARFAEERL